MEVLTTATKPPPELPNEILLLIIQECPGSTLKCLRLASKSLAQMVEPRLWQHVVLVPNDSCILGLMKALRRSRVTQHTTKLTYDARFGAFFTNIRKCRAGLTVLPSVTTARTSLFLDRASQGQFKHPDDMAIESAILSKTLRILPNLREVRIRDYEAVLDPAPTNIPRFYLNVCRFIGVSPGAVTWSALVGPPGRSHSKAFLTAVFAAGSRIHTFRSKNIDGRAFLGAVLTKSPAAYQQMNIFVAVMDSLRELELSFRSNSLASSTPHAIIQALQTLLKSSRKLKTLKLRLTDCSACPTQYSEDDFVSDLSSLVETTTGTRISGPIMPRLENLILDACVCHDEDLIHFLKIHAATLKRLELSNITLLGGEGRRECWVRLIKCFKTDLKLESISFSGWLSNGGRQQWFVAKDTVGTQRLKPRVERYVVDRHARECPLDRVAIRLSEGDVEKPVNGEEFEGDLSWTMVYSNRFGAYVDWQPTEPVFGLLPEVSTTSSEFEVAVSTGSHDTTAVGSNLDHFLSPDDLDAESTLGTDPGAVAAETACTFDTPPKHALEDGGFSESSWATTTEIGW